MVKEYDSKILYHARKANVVTNALSHKDMSTPCRDLCLRMVIVSSLLDMIKKA